MTSSSLTLRGDGDITSTTADDDDANAAERRMNLRLAGAARTDGDAKHAGEGDQYVVGDDPQADGPTATATQPQPQNEKGRDDRMTSDGRILQASRITSGAGTRTPAATMPMVGALQRDKPTPHQIRRCASDQITKRDRHSGADRVRARQVGRSFDRRSWGQVDTTSLLTVAKFESVADAVSPADDGSDESMLVRPELEKETGASVAEYRGDQREGVSMVQQSSDDVGACENEIRTQEQEEATTPKECGDASSSFNRRSWGQEIDKATLHLQAVAKVASVAEPEPKGDIGDKSITSILVEKKTGAPASGYCNKEGQDQDFDDFEHSTDEENSDDEKEGEKEGSSCGSCGSEEVTVQERDHVAEALSCGSEERMKQKQSCANVERDDIQKAEEKNGKENEKEKKNEEREELKQKEEADEEERRNRKEETEDNKVGKELMRALENDDVADNREGNERATGKADDDLEEEEEVEDEEDEEEEEEESEEEEGEESEEEDDEESEEDESSEEESGEESEEESEAEESEESETPKASASPRTPKVRICAEHVPPFSPANQVLRSASSSPSAAAAEREREHLRSPDASMRDKLLPPSPLSSTGHHHGHLSVPRSHSRGHHSGSPHLCDWDALSACSATSVLSGKSEYSAVSAVSSKSKTSWWSGLGAESPHSGSGSSATDVENASTSPSAAAAAAASSNAVRWKPSIGRVKELFSKRFGKRNSGDGLPM